MKIDITEQELFHLLFNNTIFSLYRESYEAGNVTSILIKLGHKLSATNLDKIIYAIETELELTDRDGVPIYNRDIWQNTLEELKK